MKTRKSQARRSADQTGLFRYTLFRCWPWMLGAVSISSVLILILASQPIVLDLFFKRLEAAFSPDASFIALLGLTLLLILANPIWNSFNTYFWQNYRRKMQIVLEGIFAKQIASYRAECFEDTAFLNRLEQAQQGLKGYISYVDGLVEDVWSYLLYFCITLLFYSSKSPVFMLLPFLLLIPALLAQALKGRIQRAYQQELAPYLRQKEHFEDCLLAKDFHKESRVRGLAPFFLDKCQAVLLQEQAAERRSERRQFRLQLGANLLETLAFGSAYGLVLWQLWQGTISLASASAIIISIELFSTMLREFAFSVLGDIWSSRITARDFRRFMSEQAPTVTPQRWTAAPALSVEALSFCYPNQKEKVLDQLNFHVPAGSFVALVGKNGAGKTTLVKVLMELYQPSQGQVRYTNRGGRGQTAAVLQNYGRYALSVRRNLRLRERTAPGEVETKMRHCLETVGLSCLLDQKQYPEGLETLLSRDFAKTELSGGQWQRLAIARAMMSEAKLLFFDEPSSAIDPLEEARLFGLLKELAEGATCFVVTHRLALCQEADQILVLDQGHLVAQGRHEDLLDCSPIYQELYMSQKELYQ